FTVFVEWVLALYRLLPREHHQPCFRPKAQPAIILLEATEPVIAPKLEPHNKSDQVCELTTLPILEEVSVEIDGLEGKPTHNPTAVDVRVKASGGYLEELMNILVEDLIEWFGKMLLLLNPLCLLCLLDLLSCSRVPSQPPCPISSLRISQFLSPASTGSCSSTHQCHQGALIHLWSPALPTREDPL
ncbi:hypothetical protein M9458_037014, partial [Cirrhinus mrigala]